MLELTDSHFLGKGTSRTCYYHPADPAKCIKIDSGQRSFSQTRQEAKYYRWLSTKRPGFSFDCLTRFHGFVETNRGPGGIYDVVRDFGPEGAALATSKTLRHYIQNGAVSAECDRWEDALRRLRESVLTNALVVGDLGPGNICASHRADGVVQLVIIDGIGHRDFLPLCDYFPALARRRSRRKMVRFGLTSVDDLLERVEQRRLQRQRSRAC